MCFIGLQNLSVHRLPSIYLIAIYLARACFTSFVVSFYCLILPSEVPVIISLLACSLAFIKSSM